MLGKSLAEIGRYAEQYAVLHQDSVGAPPHAALVRYVKRQDLPALGLNCMVDWGVIEEPPYVLVVLQGSFQPNYPDAAAFRGPPAHYLAYIYDVWAGEVTYVDATADAGHFKKILNNPALPDPVAPASTNCPAFQGTRMHYGSTPPTPIMTALPYVPPPTHIPGPVPTEAAPLPAPMK
ncbi:MAG TPA: hypothetical protein VF276_17680 [Chloroflexia bacterium]